MVLASATGRFDFEEVDVLAVVVFRDGLVEDKGFEDKRGWFGVHVHVLCVVEMTSGGRAVLR